MQVEPLQVVYIQVQILPITYLTQVNQALEPLNYIIFILMLTVAQIQLLLLLPFYLSHP